MEEIIYIGYYNSLNNKQKRNIFLSAVNKMSYIVEILDKEFQVNIISVSESKEIKNYPLTQEKIFNNSKLILFPTLKYGNQLQRKIQRFFVKLHLIKYIFKNTSKNTKVIVYHSLGYMNIIKWLKKIKKFKLILEVEEIYSDVLENTKIRSKEINFTQIADGYIFPTELLNKEINKKNKPYCIIYGTYKVEEEVKEKFNDNKIHVVYAGTFDSRKGGVMAAITAAEYLDERYHLHIIGFGTELQVEEVKKQIEKMGLKTKCTITYDGLKSGKEYIEFIQKCNIGLSTQNPAAKFNSTSYPSKILSYMANGLRVVSIKIPVVEYSAIGKYIYYYDNQTAFDIAKVIKNIKLQDTYSGREIISNLNKKFKYNINKLLRNL